MRKVKASGNTSQKQVSGGDTGASDAGESDRDFQNPKDSAEINSPTDSEAVGTAESLEGSTQSTTDNLKSEVEDTT